ncbi:hypothetical protein [Nocardia sp. NPDC052566]|uniref:hypothetical protein n=1 Tax=Nocardia sp. NPDC052566 TaxID=3364330 RepID=UPI0037CA3549
MTVYIRRDADGLVVIAPPGAPTVLDGTPAIDTAVLEVLGGHLSWSLPAGQRIPAAVIDDLDLAQEWIWAVYGERIALVIAEVGGEDEEFAVDPSRPELVSAAWRLGYAHWAARWWPASTIDGIAPLDAGLLAEEIAKLTEECEALVDGADASMHATEPATTESLGRAEDYALAAGPGARAGALILSRGTGGWDWRRCPPGLLDASERAVTWTVTRESGATVVRVGVVAAPGLGTALDLPALLRPRAIIGTSTGSTEAELTLTGDTWIGEATPPSSTDSTANVDIYVPGVGPAAPSAPNAPQLRQQVRDLATARLRRATGTIDHVDALLLAEIAAAASDSDY